MKIPQDRLDRLNKLYEDQLKDKERRVFYLSFKRYWGGLTDEEYKEYLELCKLKFGRLPEPLGKKLTPLSLREKWAMDGLIMGIKDED
ncbi:hypothetical protein PSHO110982_01100 [Pseudostreptobacillus hongkongensis]